MLFGNKIEFDVYLDIKSIHINICLWKCFIFDNYYYYMKIRLIPREIITFSSLIAFNLYTKHGNRRIDKRVI